MATVFNWRVDGLFVTQTPGTNTVVMINFTVRGEDQGIYDSVNYSVELRPASLDNFVPFEQITHEQAIAWTKEALGQQRVEAMQQEVQNKIDEQKKPIPTKANLPWV